MLKVICNQRDRFRARLHETEEEIRQLKEKIGVLTAEVEKTKADNVKLYGKICYVQDYNLEKVVSRGSKKPVDDLESGFTSDIESKYKKIYEDNVNPFAAFSKRKGIKDTRSWVSETESHLAVDDSFSATNVLEHLHFSIPSDCIS